MIEKAYARPTDALKMAVQIKEARNSLKEMIGEMEEKFGNRPLDENSFSEFVRWKTCQDVLQKHGNNPEIIKKAKNLRTDYYGNVDIFSKDSHLRREFTDTGKKYKENFVEVVKNQKAKEAAVKDLPESTKRLMRLKMNYTLKDLDKSITTLGKHKAEVAKEAAKPKKAPSMGG